VVGFALVADVVTSVYTMATGAGGNMV